MIVDNAFSQALSLSTVKKEKIRGISGSVGVLGGYLELSYQAARVCLENLCPTDSASMSDILFTLLGPKQR